MAPSWKHSLLQQIERQSPGTRKGAFIQTIYISDSVSTTDFTLFFVLTLPSEISDPENVYTAKGLFLCTVSGEETWLVVIPTHCAKIPPRVIETKGETNTGSENSPYNDVSL
jgi:hypothetical protein